MITITIKDTNKSFKINGKVYNTPCIFKTTILPSKIMKILKRAGIGSIKVKSEQNYGSIDSPRIRRSNSSLQLSLKIRA